MCRGHWHFGHLFSYGMDAWKESIQTFTNPCVLLWGDAVYSNVVGVLVIGQFTTRVVVFICIPYWVKGELGEAPFDSAIAYT